MFACDFSEKIFQTLPGQGWRVLIDWNPEPADIAEGFPQTTLEPVISFVSAKIPRMRKQDTVRFDEVVIAPLVRYPDGRELVLLDGRADNAHKYVYLAPGEELAQRHFDRLGSYGFVSAASVEGASC